MDQDLTADEPDSGMEDVYPPDSDYEGLDDPDEMPDIDTTPSGPGNVPVPRAAGIRQKALANKQNNPKQQRAMKKRSSRILAQQKRRQALELRKAGVTYEDIAQMVGYHDASGARKAVLKAEDKLVQEPANEIRTLQVERLNFMLVALWNQVKTGDTSAINTSLRVMERIDALMGTEAAKEVNVNQTTKGAVLVIDGNKDDYIRALQQMSGAGVQADGTNARAIGGTPPGMQRNSQGVDNPVELPPPPQIVQAEVVERDLHPNHQQDSIEELVQGEAPKPAKKKFSFGVDPTVRKKGKQ